MKSYTRLRSLPWHGKPERSNARDVAMTANNEDNLQSPATPSESKPLSTDTPPPNPSSEHASLPPPPTPDRLELLVRARHFLSSPQVIDQDYESKRRFLAEKGLTDGEIQLLLREMVRRLSLYPKTQCSLYVPESIRSRQWYHHGYTLHLLRPVCQNFS